MRWKSENRILSDGVNAKVCPSKQNNLNITCPMFFMFLPPAMAHTKKPKADECREEVILFFLFISVYFVFQYLGYDSNICVMMMQLLGCHGPLAQRQAGRAFIDSAV